MIVYKTIHHKPTPSGLTPDTYQAADNYTANIFRELTNCTQLSARQKILFAMLGVEFEKAL